MVRSLLQRVRTAARHEPRAVLWAPTRQDAHDLIRGAIAARYAPGRADWPVPTHKDAHVVATAGGDTYSVRSVPTRDATFFARAKGARETLVEARGFGEGPAEGTVDLVALALPLDSAGPLVASAVGPILDAHGSGMRRLVLILTDALAALDQGVPALDALDRWQRLRDDDEADAPPLARAADPERWRPVLARADLQANGRLSALLAAAGRGGAQRYVLPVCLRGFHLPSSLPASPSRSDAGAGDDGPSDAVPFNLAPLASLLSIHHEPDIQTLLDGGANETGSGLRP